MKGRSASFFKGTATLTPTRGLKSEDFGKYSKNGSIKYLLFCFLKVSVLLYSRSSINGNPIILSVL